MIDQTEIKTATIADAAFIRDLQRQFTNEIGFVPTSATERELMKNNIVMGTLAGMAAGFVFVQPVLAAQPRTACIIQAAVRMDAQRRHVGLALVEHVAARALHIGSTILQAKCLDGLEANDFWKAAGFTEILRTNGGTSRGQKLIWWRRALIPGAAISRIPLTTRTRRPGGRFTHRTPPNTIPLFPE